MLVEVKIGALIMDPNTNSPIVVLKGVDSETVLPIWVGAFEANAIALEIEKIVPQRPMTHDLLRNVIVECGLRPSRVIVTELVSMDARPSDAIALALRLDCPIFVQQKVLDLSAASSQAGSEKADEDPSTSPEEWPDLIG
jgi:uncharacterized protein